jgi:hypothetical protein
MSDLPLYPVTIVRTRYQGVYEGGSWAAFNAYENELPQDAFDDDVTCCDWWCTPENVANVGVGNTPDAAFNDLLHKYGEK